LPLEMTAMQWPPQTSIPEQRREMPTPRLDLSTAWELEIEFVESAIDVLLALVRHTREEDFRMETVLWRRHHERLWSMKRKLDAVVM
jgi:hypothetical protein